MSKIIELWQFSRFPTELSQSKWCKVLQYLSIKGRTSTYSAYLLLASGKGQTPQGHPQSKTIGVKAEK